MTTLDDDIATFISRFHYEVDIRDRWSRIEDTARGDCEDFALTILWILAGRSWWRLFWWVLTLRAMPWYTRAGGQPHIMLWIRGRGWIDNIHPNWSIKPKHPRIYPILAPVLALKLLIKQ